MLGGLNEATYLAQQAKAHGFNVMRLFGIADVNYNEGMPLQSSPGAPATRLIERLKATLLSIIVHLTSPRPPAACLPLARTCSFPQEQV